MQFLNNTPFPSLAWENLDPLGHSYISIVTRVKYCNLLNAPTEKWDLFFHPDQQDLFFEDIFYGETGKSSVRYESDLCSFKPKCDIIINANSYKPKSIKDNSWFSGVLIKNTENKALLDYRIKVCDSYQWTRFKKNQDHESTIFSDEWRIALQTNNNYVPILYENAFGGGEKDANDKWLSFCNQNPIGVGNIPSSSEITSFKGVQLFPTDWIIEKARPFDVIPVVGTGIIHRSWQPRLALAGTYDQDWLDNHWPLLPKDFSYLHNQAAPIPLQLSNYLQGGEEFRLRNVFSDLPLFHFTLPPVKFFAELTDKYDSYVVPMPIDTVIIDLMETDDAHIYVSYRQWFKVATSITKIELFMDIPDYLTEAAIDE